MSADHAGDEGTFNFLMHLILLRNLWKRTADKLPLIRPNYTSAYYFWVPCPANFELDAVSSGVFTIEALETMTCPSWN